MQKNGVGINLQNASLIHSRNSGTSVFLLLVVSLGNYYVSLLMPASHLLNFWSLAWFSFSSIYVWQDKKVCWLFFPYIFGIFSALLSCFIAEAIGLYLIEIESSAYLSGATSRASSLSAIFIIATYLFVNFLNKNKINMCVICEIKYVEYKLFKIFLVLTIAYLLIAMYWSIPPLLTGNNRFNYINDEALPGFRFFYTLIPFLSFLLALCYIFKLITKNKMILWILIIILLVIITGEKFSLYMDIFFYFSTPFIIYGSIKLNKKFYSILGTLVIMLFGMVWVNYVMRGDDLNYLFMRMSLQGQMIFALDLISTKGIIFDFTKFLESFLGLSIDVGNRSMYHLMHQIAPENTVNVMIDYNQSFTAPFPSNFPYFFTNEYAPLAIVIYAVPVAYSIYAFYKGILSGSLFNAFISAALFHYMNLATMMGKTERLIHPIVIFSFIITLILLGFGAQYSKRKLSF